MNRRRMPASSIWVLALAALLPLSPVGLVAQDQPVLIRGGTVIDGSGEVLEDASILVRNGRIVEVGDVSAPEGADTYDLNGYTVLPGLIDTHVHIGNHFNAATGRIPGPDTEESPAEIALYGAENAYATLMSGFTTVQSMGSPSDIPLRNAIDRGTLPGARILTSIRWIRDGTPEELRQQVRDVASQGADLIKLFASGSLRIGAPPTMSQEQLDAACDEARRLGLRTAVHAHGPVSATRASNARCTVIEHGAFLDRETLETLAENGTYFDPNIYLVSVNYLDNQDKFIGVGNYTEEGFRRTRESIPVKLEMFETALQVPDLKILLGTDAVAGAHGRQAIELVYRVQEAGQDPMEAIVSATSLAAESLEMDDRIGTIAPGMEADIIALEGNPLDDITALHRVVFVMKGGDVYKTVPSGAASATMH